MPPQSVSRWTALAAVAIVLIGATLRLWGITSGAPYRMAADEWVILSTSVGMVRAGDFNPHFFDYGGLIFYLHMGVAVVRFLTGANTGAWQTLEGMWDGEVLVYSRVLTAVLGALTVAVVFRCGLRWGTGTALVAALAMAVLPQHVRESHFVLTDVPLTFFIAVALLLSIRAAEGQRAMRYFWAGAAVGAAAAVKYNGALSIVIPLVAALATDVSGLRVRAATAVLAGAAASFFVAAPYSLLDLPAFLNGFASLMQHYNGPRPVAEALVVYLKYMRNWFAWPGVLSLELGWPALVVACLGLVVLLRDARFGARRAVALAAAVFPLVHLWFVTNQGSLQYGRYLLPLSPGLCLMLGAGTVLVWHWIRGFRRLARFAPMVGLLLVPPFAASVSWAHTQTRVSTADLAAEWITRHLPPDEPLVVEAEAFHLPPPRRVENVLKLVDQDLEHYREMGVVYLVASSLEEDRYVRDPVRHAPDLAAYRAMRGGTEIVQIFASSKEHPGSTLTILRIPRH